MINAKELRIGNCVRVKEGTVINYIVSEVKKECVALTNTVIAMPDLWMGYDDLSPIPLSPEILLKCGFEGDVWYNISLGIWLVGEEGYNNLIAGKTSSPDGLPIHLGIEQSSGDNCGFTIQQAAELQKGQNEMDDEAFILKRKSTVWLPPIKYLHELQNIFYSLTGKELEYTP